MNRFSARIRCLRPCSIQAPFGRRHDPGHEIEGKDPLGAGAVAVDVERNPHVQECALGRLLPAQQLAVRHRLDQLDERPGGRARLAAGLEHLVEERAGLIVLESHGAALLLVRDGRSLNRQECREARQRADGLGWRGRGRRPTRE